MSIIKEVRNIKKKNDNTIILIKNGSFYRCFEKDAYILAYIMEYQVKEQVDNVLVCGFPVNSLDKVIQSLEKTCINYKVMDLKEDITQREQNFEDKNVYENIYLKSSRYVNIKRRIGDISRKLFEIIDRDEIINVITDIEKILYNVQ